MLETVDTPILDVTQFPWVGNPTDFKTQEEFAYVAGQTIARLRGLLNDDSQELIINRGAGPNPEPKTPDVERLRASGAGSFGILTALEPDDLDLYRRILPDCFAMPDRPVLSLMNLDYNQPNPIARYKEGMVMLKGVGADGEETWYVHSMPVETWLMLVMGHDWGFRKELFDMTVTPAKTAVMQRDGDLYMSLELTGQPVSGDTEWLISQEHVGGHNNMAVLYPRRPDLMLRFGWTGTPIVLEQNPGMVAISVNRSLDWAGLVPEGAAAPGYFQRYIIHGGDAYIKKVREA